MKPPLEAQTQSFTHTDTRLEKQSITSGGSGSHVQPHCRPSPDLPGVLQPNWPAGWTEQNYSILTQPHKAEEEPNVRGCHPVDPC